MDSELHDDILEIINRRRRQILIHSYLYYEADSPIISDKLWTKWAIELEELQKEYPEISKEGFMAEAFNDFDHSTGFDLPFRDEWVVKTANYILRIHKEV